MKKFVVLILGMLCINLGFSNTLSKQTEDAPLQYNAVEVKPLFPGGMSEFMKFVMKNYQVPESEDGEVVTGTVHVSIIIDKDGNVTNIQILRDVGSAGKEIKRVLSKCPKWTPGRNKGVNVAVEYNFPITIR